eukprot:762198-Amphidinium_carterae.1
MPLRVWMSLAPLLLRRKQQQQQEEQFQGKGHHLSAYLSAQVARASLERPFSKVELRIIEQGGPMGPALAACIDPPIANQLPKGPTSVQRLSVFHHLRSPARGQLLASAMPLIQLSDEQRTEAKSKWDSELAWILADSEVPEEMQLALSHVGYHQLKIFMGLGETRTEVKSALKSDIGLDAESIADAGLAQHQQVALVIAAWEASRDYVAQERKDCLEARASNLPKELQVTEQSSMRVAYEASYGKLEKSRSGRQSILGVEAGTSRTQRTTPRELA